MLKLELLLNSFQGGFYYLIIPCAESAACLVGASAVSGRDRGGVLCTGARNMEGIHPNTDLLFLKIIPRSVLRHSGGVFHVLL